MPPQVALEGHITLPDGAKSILQALFAGCQRVIVKREFTGNLSGSRVFWVQSITERGAQLPAVVKFAAPSLIEKEWRAYQAVRQMLYGMVEVQDKYIPTKGRWGALSYPLQGGGTFEVTSFYDYYHNAATADVITVLRRLFDMLGSIHNQHQPALEFPWRTSYDRVLPVNLLIEVASPPSSVPVQGVTARHSTRVTVAPDTWVRLEGFAVTKVDLRKNTVTLNVPQSQNASGTFRVRAKSTGPLQAYQMGEIIPTLEGKVLSTRQSQLLTTCRSVLDRDIDAHTVAFQLSDEVSLPNPLLRRSDTLNQYRSVRMSLIHGDLNLHNILVDPEIGEVSLIDIADAREDHVLHDFLRLETEVVTHLLPETLYEHNLQPAPTMFDLYGQLHCATFERQALVSPTIPGCLQKPFEVLVTVRQAAYRYFYSDSPEEYYQGLLLYLTGALKFSNLDRSPTAPLPKRAAFWAAAAVAWLLDTKPACQHVASFNLQSGPPHARIVAYEPEVRVRRKGSDYLTNVAYGTPLYHGDIVSTYTNAQALVLCQPNQTLFTVPPERNQSVDCRKVPQEQVLARFQFHRPVGIPQLLNDFSYNVRLHRESSEPLLLSPRNTRTIDVRPTFQWRAVPGAQEYRLSLRAPGGLGWCQESNATTLPYPAHAPPLKLGSGNTVVLEPLGGLVAPEVTRLIVLDAETLAQVQTQESEIHALALSESAESYLLALLYQDQRLWSAAIRQLERLVHVAQSIGPDVWLRLGELNMRIGLYARAEKHYRQTLHAAPQDQDAFVKIMARVGLVCANFALGNEDQAQLQIQALREEPYRELARWLRVRFSPPSQKPAAYKGEMDLLDYARFLAEKIAGQLREEIQQIPRQFLEQLQAMRTYTLDPSRVAATLGPDKFSAMEILAATFITTHTLIERLTLEELEGQTQSAQMIQQHARQVAEEMVGLSSERALDFSQRYTDLVKSDPGTLKQWLIHQGE
jgi:tetratricopeptide (TPR) repeat protein